MPVSRKRKKTNKSRKTHMPRPRVAQSILEDFVAHRRHLDARRRSRATVAAEALMPGLAELAVDGSVADIEDAICRRLGEQMAVLEEAESVEEIVDPNAFVESLLDTVGEAVREALNQQADDLDLPPWRVLTTIARTLPFPLSEQAATTIAELRSVPGGSLLPAPPRPVSVNGPVLWTRDAYGSRFGITAMFSAPGQPDRWYLWDIDTCGLAPSPVFSGYFPDAETAFAHWRAGVGDIAVSDAILTPVDHFWLMSELLPAEEGLMRIGGEDAAQMAEYHRGKRLADEVRQAVNSPSRKIPADRLDSTQAHKLFTAWLAEHEAPRPDNVEELIDELAEYWKSEPSALYHTCSPHRVANAVRGIRDYFQAEFADELIALLPDWTAWLSEFNGTPAHLAERAVIRARETASSGESAEADPLARVKE